MSPLWTAKRANKRDACVKDAMLISPSLGVKHILPAIYEPSGDLWVIDEIIRTPRKQGMFIPGHAAFVLVFWSDDRYHQSTIGEAIAIDE